MFQPKPLQTLFLSGPLGLGRCRETTWPEVLGSGCASHFMLAAARKTTACLVRTDLVTSKLRTVVARV